MLELQAGSKSRIRLRGERFDEEISTKDHHPIGTEDKRGNGR